MISTVDQIGRTLAIVVLTLSPLAAEASGYESMRARGDRRFVRQRQPRSLLELRVLAKWSGVATDERRPVYTAVDASMTETAPHVKK